MSRAGDEQFVLLAGRGVWRLARITDAGVEMHRLPAKSDADAEAEAEAEAEAHAHAHAEAGLDAAPTPDPDPDPDPDPAPEDRAQVLAEQLEALGHDGRPIALCIDSSRCLCAEVATDDLERSGRRKAMTYRLEEHLPIAAEDVVADFLETGEATALSVCTRVEDLQPTLDALRARELRVRHILCDAVLAAGFAASRNDSLDVVLHARETRNPQSESWDLIEIDRGRPARWWWFADDRESVAERLRSLADSPRAEPLRVAILTGDIEATERVKRDAGEAGIHWQSIDATPEEAAATRAAAVLRDAAPPWIDLRRDALAAPNQWEVYRKPAIALAAAAALLLASVAGIAWHRAAQYEQQAEAQRQQLTGIYREVMDLGPREPVPDAFSLRRRMQNEQRQLAGIGGVASDRSRLDDMRPPSALVLLDRLLATLPGEEIRFRVLEIRIEPDRLRVQGEAQSHAQAEQIVVALRESGRFEVRPPETRSLRGERGVSFGFLATPLSPSNRQPVTNRTVQRPAEPPPKRGGET